MLEDHAFCDSCPGCRPAMIDVKTGKPVPPDDPKVLAINLLWDKRTTYEQRKAYIEVTLHNSRKPEDMRLCQEVLGKIEVVLKGVE